MKESRKKWKPLLELKREKFESQEMMKPKLSLKMTKKMKRQPWYSVLNSKTEETRMKIER